MHSTDDIEWQIESIRTTVFLNGALSTSTLQSWLEKVSNGASTRLNITPTSFQGVARTTAGLLRVNWASNRLDVILASEDPKDVRTIAKLSLGNDLFTQFFLPLKDLGELPPIGRIAYGLVLSSQVESESAGLDALSKLLTRVKLSKACRDFSYRLNIPVESKTLPGLIFNRLATWLVGQTQILQLQIKDDGSQVQSNLLENPPFDVRLEMDLSTDAQAQLNCSSSDFEKLLHELSGLSLDIAAHGESALSD